MMSSYGKIDLAKLYIKRAFLFSFLIHSVLLALNIKFETPEMKLRTDAILVSMTPPVVTPPKERVLIKESPLKESEAVKPKEKVIAGTKKIVPKATALGDPKAAKVQKVQKGDPVSKNMTKYKPGTEFRKTPTTNIGTGASGPALPSAKIGGGSGDTYKAPNFATKSTTGFAPLGARFKAKRDAIDDFGAGSGKDGGIGDGSGRGFGDGIITGSRNGTVETAKILTNVGSLTGATVGTIGSSKGSEGLSTKGTVVLAGIPDETVILGSMDPNVIRRILMEHLAQFRYCYQSELDSTEKPKDVSGVIQLNFNIGLRGEVQRVNIGGGTAITPKVKGCVGDILRDITFPAPKGGGIVEVKQPMNFYPKSY